MKTCKTCNTTKPYSDFYKHSKMTDGYLNTCKECKRKQQQETRNNNLEYYQNYDRNRPNKEERNEKNKEYQRTDKGKISHAKAISKSRDKYPLRYKAVNAVKAAKPEDLKSVKNTTHNILLIVQAIIDTITNANRAASFVLAGALK